MIRGLMIFDSSAKPVYSKMFDGTPSEGEDGLAMNALVSAVISFVPMLSGGQLDEISLGDARVILHTEDEMIFSIAVDSDDKEDYRKRLKIIAKLFLERYGQILDITEDTASFDSGEFTGILVEKKLTS